MTNSVARNFQDTEHLKYDWPITFHRAGVYQIFVNVAKGYLIWHTNIARGKIEVRVTGKMQFISEAINAALFFTDHLPGQIGVNQTEAALAPNSHAPSHFVVEANSTKKTNLTATFYDPHDYLKGASRFQAVWRVDGKLLGPYDALNLTMNFTQTKVRSSLLSESI